MNSIILNGSPKGKSGNSEIFARQFIKDMKNPCEIKYIVRENHEQLAEYVERFDAIIMIMPLYVHAMPGIVMKFIEHLKPAVTNDKALGFIIQAGFPETAHEKYIESYLSILAKELNYKYLGTVSKGEAAGTYMKPEFMNKKLFKQLNDLGRKYEETGAFDKRIKEELGKPYELTKFQVRFLELMYRSGIGNVGWNKFLKDNNAYDKRLDRPFLQH
jgi:multimeric flavodoxin WrbA